MSWNESSLFSLFVNAALKSTAILAVAWMAALVLRRRSAAARHLVWTAAAAAVVALPLLTVGMPALHIPSLAVPFQTNLAFQTTATGSAATAVENAPLNSVLGPVAAPVKPAFDWMRYIMLAWAAGAVFGLLQMLAAAIAMLRVRRTAVPFAGAEFCGSLARTLGIRHQVEVLESAAGSMPMTFGLLRTAILLPSDAAEWSEERRRVVLLHELAHVRRGDVATHLLARVALSLHWWNPLAWTAWRSFVKERERATDDLVLQAGARASDYAGHLLDVARTMQAGSAMGWAAIAMARPSQLEGRLLSILDPRVNRQCPRRATAGLAALLAVAAVAPLAAVQAQDATQTVAPDVDATIRAANAQKNHEILDNAAQAFEKLRQFDTAQKLLEQAAQIRAQASGQQSADYAIGLLKLGDLEQRRNNDKSAQDFYQRAVQILGDRPEAAPALIHLGIAALIQKNYPQAMDRFQQVQRIDPAMAGMATMWMAVVNDRQKDFAAAEALFRSALTMQNPKSADAATTMVLYAQLMREQGRMDEAVAMEQQSAATRKTSGTASVSTAVNGVYRIGGGVTAPVLMFKREPEYSEVARAAKLQGTVTLYVEVGPDGAPHNMKVIRSLGMALDEKAIDAVSQWQFRPGMKDGKPVTVAATIEVNFRLL